jgi:hypothetical protein
MPPEPQYRLALARVASFIGALQRVRRVEPLGAADDVPGRGSPPPSMSRATR